MRTPLLLFAVAAAAVAADARTETLGGLLRYDSGAQVPLVGSGVDRETPEGAVSPDAQSLPVSCGVCEVRFGLLHAFDSVVCVVCLATNGLFLFFFRLRFSSSN